MSWKSGGLRGSTLEELVNLTNESYRSKGLAIVQKIPTPITPVQMNGENRTITLAYFNQKSTVDYIGAAQGLPICFDAKETGRKSLPIQNIHEHQMDFMGEFEKQRGLAFLLVHFSEPEQYFLLPYEHLKKYWDAAVKRGGRKSVPFADFDQRLRIYNRDGFYVHYLEAINMYFDIKHKH